MHKDFIDDPAALTAAIETKNRLEAIIATAMDAIITIDNRHRIIFFNPAAEAMFGMASSEAIGQPISRFIPERFRSAHEGHIRRFGKTGETGRRMGTLGAISGLRANGQEFPLEASISQAVVDNERLSTVILRDITERKANEDARALLAREVDHRAKNALAIVQALVSLTRAPSRDAFVEAVTGRVSALARAHSLLAQNRWSGAALRKVVQDEVSAYERPGQVHYRGPDIMLSPKAVQPIGLLIHELATNAVKYGALSTVKGRVDVEWELKNGEKLYLCWRETNGPPVSTPKQKGFGSNLITTVTGLQLGGDVEIDWDPKGIVVNAALPAGVMRPQDIPNLIPVTAGTPRPPPLDRRKPGKLLIVEDEMLIAMQLTESLEEAGWSIMGPAATIEEANQLLSTSPIPDAAILDVNLDGNTVYPLADTLQRLGVPILFCTGYENLDAAQQFEDCERIRKPADAAQLIGAVRVAIDKQERKLRPPT
ncbi:HWE histidine kinase domain-containing protein [Rhizorhapis suberifaciens]|uniref:histidine kinase n=1 Tax=Rhizorhapis suberifaciens TaxID=13656 RepID=A0A840HXA1_9SPHN|nr:HWE histidine kinase domain-containing protein [Rhizorhapis suberifaciens]MBB4642237.1 PAS domain S-box-containing protein [Rhizorhapis suberifaciens]